MSPNVPSLPIPSSNPLCDEKHVGTSPIRSLRTILDYPKLYARGVPDLASILHTSVLRDDPADTLAQNELIASMYLYQHAAGHILKLEHPPAVPS